MDLQAAYSYKLYLSWGEFKNGYNTYVDHVVGDKDASSDKPLFLNWNIPMDFETFSGSIRNALTIGTLTTALLISYL